MTRAVLLVVAAVAGCAPFGTPDAGPPARSCALIDVDLVVGTGNATLYLRPATGASDCRCTESFQPLDACVGRSTDYSSCSCSDGAGLLVPGLAAASLVRGDDAVSFDVTAEAVGGGSTWIETGALDPAATDGVELVLAGCWGEARVPVAGGAFPPPSLVEGSGGYSVEPPPGTAHLLDCYDPSGISSGCCPLDEPLQPGHFARAERDDGTFATAAGEVRVWRESSARAACIVGVPTTSVDCADEANETDAGFIQDGDGGLVGADGGA